MYFFCLYILGTYGVVNFFFRYRYLLQEPLVKIWDVKKTRQINKFV